MYAANGLTCIVDEIFAKAYEKKIIEIASKTKYFPSFLEKLVDNVDFLRRREKIGLKMNMSDEFGKRDLINEKMISELEYLKNLSLENKDYLKYDYDNISSIIDNEKFSKESKKLKKILEDIEKHRKNNKIDDDDDDDFGSEYKRRRWKELF